MAREDDPPPLSRLPAPLAERADYLVHRLGEALRLDTARALRDLRLTEHQYTSLQIVAADGGCSRQSIEAISGLDPASITVAVNSLVRRSALAVGRPESDRRKRVYSMTPEGRDVLAEAEEKAREARKRTLGALDVSERDAFLDHLRTLVEGT